MRPTHYLAVAVRLFSLFMVFLAVRQSSVFIELMGGDTSGPVLSWFFAITSTALPAIAAVFLWFFPMMVAKSIIKPDIDQPLEQMGAQSVLTVLILAIALYNLHSSLMDTVYWVTLWQVSERSHGLEAAIYLNPESKANMLTTGAELLLSILVIVKARSLAVHVLRLAK